MSRRRFHISGFNSSLAVTVLSCSLLFACKKQEPPEDPGPPIVVMTQYLPGVDFAQFAETEHLQGAPVRESAASAPDHRDLVYFGAEGNLHVSVKRDAAGHEMLSATPFIVPSDLTAEERLAKWDSGVNREEDMRGRPQKR